MAFYIVLGMAGSLLVGWTVVSVGVAWILVRQWMFHTLLLIGSGIPVALSLCALFEVAPEAWDWIQGGVIGLLVALSLSLFVAAYCRRLIGWRRMSTVSLLVVVLFTCLALLVPQLPTAHRAWPLAWLLATSPLPFVAFAAAPLALSWTRRR